MYFNDQSLSERLKKFIKDNAKSRKHEGVFFNYLSGQVQLAKLFVSGLAGKLASRKSIDDSEVAVDVLFIHHVGLMRRLKRKRGIFSRLEQLRITYAEIDPHGSRDIARSGEMYGSSDESLMFQNFDLHAQYLIKRYQPKVVVTDSNGDLFSPFLKKRSAEMGCQVVHLPHSVITTESTKYRMMDYHYYLLYGASSLECLKELDAKFGECKVILAGSYLFDKDFSLPPAEESGYVLLLGMGPAMEDRQHYAQYYHSVLEWARLNPSIQLHVRLHPRSSGEYWVRAAAMLPNVVLRPQGELFIDSCRGAFMCITSYTNAVVDAALLGRPSLLVCGEDVVDYLQVESFYSPRAVSVEAISKSIERYREQLIDYQEKAERFAKFHVNTTNQSVETITKIIAELVAGKLPQIDCKLKGVY